MASEHPPISCLKIEPAGEVTVVRFTRELVLSGHEAEDAGTQLAALLDEPGRRRLVVNFGNVRSLSSLMLSELIKLQRKAKSVGATGAVQPAARRPRDL